MKFEINNDTWEIRKADKDKIYRNSFQVKYMKYLNKEIGDR